jgi:MFS family permease
MDHYSLMQKNFRHLYADMLWYGLLSGSAIAFMSIYAARLGANAFEIGLLTAGPALLNLLVSLPAGRWLHDRSLIRSAFWSSALQRFGYLPLILLPWFFGSKGQVMAMILITLYMAVPGTILAISFNAMFAEVVPSEWRAEVVGKRNALLAVSTTLGTLLSGYLLDQIVFPLNYQIVFGIGVLGASASTYHLARLRSAPERFSPWRLNGRAVSASLIRFRNILNNIEKLPLAGSAWLSSLSRLDLLKGRLGLFMLSYLIFYASQYFCIPLFPLAYVNSLHLSDGVISLGSALFYASMFIISLRLKQFAVRYGHRKMLYASALLFGAYPLMIGLARGPILYWIGSFLGGAIYGVLNASLLNRLMETVPEGERPAGMAFHNLALNLGILLGSLSGPFTGNTLGIQGGLLVGAALRFLAGLLLFAWA